MNPQLPNYTDKIDHISDQLKGLVPIMQNVTKNIHKFTATMTAAEAIIKSNQRQQ